MKSMVATHGKYVNGFIIIGTFQRNLLGNRKLIGRENPECPKIAEWNIKYKTKQLQSIMI